MTDLFADAVADITVINGVVRFNLVTLEPDPASREKGEPRTLPTVQRRLVMPLPGFINAVAQAQALLVKLEQAGVLQRNAGEGARDGKAPQPAAAKAPPTSPNF
ncbi:MAG: hypothetical protein JNK67_32525 [Alphaproteobacteria bacterium]|nr:hypothetical protein [Alphaproteobacteria bacterium]